MAVPESAGSGRHLPASRPGHAPCRDPQHLVGSGAASWGSRPWGCEGGGPAGPGKEEKPQGRVSAGAEGGAAEEVAGGPGSARIAAKHNPGAPSALPPHSRRRHAGDGGSSCSSARSLARGPGAGEGGEGGPRAADSTGAAPPAPSRCSLAQAWKGSLQPLEQRVGLQPPAPPPVPSLRAETPLWSRREPVKSSLQLCAPTPLPLPSPRP
ncbi:uncharacterized protein LOC141584995 [Saimiri boliviensis]|uniref:uncharacterized protein LOC141584995 n=1 Tax=Saimiri boliviensis TaxID=27679 RepID=UPI003D76F5FF